MHGPSCVPIKSIFKSVEKKLKLKQFRIGNAAERHIWSCVIETNPNAPFGQLGKWANWIRQHCEAKRIAAWQLRKVLCKMKGLTIGHAKHSSNLQMF